MGALATAFANVFRRFNTDGVADSGAHKVAKTEAQALGATIEDYIDTAVDDLTDTVGTAITGKVDASATLAVDAPGGSFTGTLGSGGTVVIIEATTPEAIAGTAAKFMTARRVQEKLEDRFGDFQLVEFPADAPYSRGWLDPNGRLVLAFRKGTGTTVLFVDDESNIPYNALSQEIKDRLLSGGAGTFESGPDDDAVRGWADLDRRPWLQFLKNGKTRAHLSDDSTIPQALVDALTPPNLLPSKNIVVWGDSMPEGIGSYVRWTTRLATLLGVTIANQGRGSQRDDEIAARQDGTPMLVTVSGNSIPASGSVDVTAYSADIGYYGGQSAWLTLDMTILGVQGSMIGQHDGSGTHGSGTYKFARTVPGDAVACPPSTPAHATLGSTYERHTAINQMGRNSADQIDRILRNDLAMRNRLTPEITRMLTLGICTAYTEYAAAGGASATNYANIVAGNAERARFLGDRFLDLRRILIDRGIELANIGFTLFGESTITKSANDIIDIGRDTVPRGLLDPTDGLHFNNAGHMACAMAVFYYFLARSWN